MEEEKKILRNVDNTTKDTGAPSLTSEETKAAVTELVSSFPKLRRCKYDPELENQLFTLLSFHIFEKPVNGVYGMVQARGTWPSLEKATEEAEKLIKEVDSVNKIHIAPTGYWSLFTNEDKFTLEKRDVSTEQSEAEIQRKAMIEQREKNEKEKKAHESRVKNLRKEEDDLDYDLDSLDYFTKTKVSYREMSGYIHQSEQKLSKMKDDLEKIRVKVKNLEKAHPEYIGQWLAHYNKARVERGFAELKEEDIDKIPTMGQYIG
jgi:hypothetical protein